MSQPFFVNPKWDVDIKKIATETPSGIKMLNPIKVIYMYDHKGNPTLNVKWADGTEWLPKDFLEANVHWNENFLRPAWNAARAVRRKSSKP